MEPLGILTLTHSSRRNNAARCSVQFLTSRFADARRLQNLPPFETLPPAEPLYSGAASFYRLDFAGERLRVRRLGSLRHRDKVQHVAFEGDASLLVGFEHHLERRLLPTALGELKRLRGTDLGPVQRITAPHLAGLHTVEPLAGGRAAVSCSASDAVLLLDLDRGEVERTLRLPVELYGQGYELGPADDLRAHFIDDAAQTTHVNAAFAHPDGRRLAVSSLIPGAVGIFDLESGAYREVARGFVGCHGARFNDRGELYFADSTSGMLVFLDPDGTVMRRFAVPTRWLHDVQQIQGSLYAFALNEPNELRIYDIDRDVLLYRRRFFTWPVEGLFGWARLLPWWLGNSTQALSFHRLTPCSREESQRPAARLQSP